MNTKLVLERFFYRQTRPKFMSHVCVTHSAVGPGYWLFIFESSKSITTIFGWDGPWVIPFQNYIDQPHPPFKMAAIILTQCWTKFNIEPYGKMFIKKLFSSPKPKDHVVITLLVHLDQRSMWTIVITWRPSSVSFSHFKLLLRNHLANWNQSFCFSFQSDIQHGCQG